jgi:creatinine amidohydrolase
MSDESLYTVIPPKTVMEMTFEEVEQLREKTDVAIVGVAAIEEHGYHLPLGMDAFFCTEIMKNAYRTLEAEGLYALLGPTIEFGVCPGAMGYAGSISMRPDTTKAIIVDVCESLYKHGFKKIVLVMGHDENLPAMAMAAQILTQSHDDLEVLSLNILFPMKAAEGPLLKSKKRDGHAGAGETGRLMVTHPNLVYVERTQSDPDLDAPFPRDIPGGGPPLIGGGVYNPARELRLYDRSRHPGQTGDPHDANVEIGRAGLEGMGAWIADVIKRDFLGI